MTISRQQLYAMGEPFGDCATRKRVDGRYLCGGGNPSTPEKTTQVQDLPDWAKPSAQKLLGKTEALTSDKPYQSYGNWAQSQGLDPSQVAGFTGMQQQAFQGAQNLAPSQALGGAQGIAGIAGLRGLGASYDPYQTGQFNQQAGSYMSPFVQQALAPQLRELGRQSEIQRNMDQARAVGQGAFGGSRSAIVDAERQRNLLQQQGDVLDRGYQQAFQQAQQQFNTENQLREQSRQYGAGLGMQGLQTALQGAGLLGQLGGQEFGQQKDIIGLQSQLGGQQQALNQAQINARLQDYAQEQKYPYQQLEFMSNILRGTPMGTVTSMYQPGPTGLQTLGALGMGAYGANQIFGGSGDRRAAGGGLMDSYAEGGSVTDEQFVAQAIRRLSDAQLQQEMQEAAQAQDQAKLAMLQEEASRRAQVRGGGAGISSLLTEEMADNIMPTQESMARGGIVAFAGDDEEEGQLVRAEPAGYSPGSPADYQYFLNRGRTLLDELGKDEEYKAATPEQQAQFRLNYIKRMQEGLGESPYAKRLAAVAEEQKGLDESLGKAKGVGALRAAAAMLQGRGFVRGLGMAGEAFANTYEKAEAANRTEKRALRDMEFNLMDAQRKERMGLNKDAAAAMREVERDRALAEKARRDRLAAQANLARGLASASKPQKPTGSGDKPLKIAEQLASAEVAYEQNPTDANLKRVTALRRAVSQTRTSDVGPARTAIESFRTTSTTDAKVEDQVRSAKFGDPAWMAAYEKNDPKAMAAAEDAIAERIRARQTAVPPGGAPRLPVPRASAPVNTNSGQPTPNRLRFDAQGNLIP